MLGEALSAQATAADPALDLAFIDDSAFNARLSLPFGWHEGRPYVREEDPDAAGLDQRGSLPLISQNPTPMRLAALRTFALSLPHTTFVKQWGECLVFKVAGKMFLIIALDADLADAVVFKCDPTDFDALTEIDGVTQAPYGTDVGKSRRSRRPSRPRTRTPHPPQLRFGRRRPAKKDPTCSRVSGLGSPKSGAGESSGNFPLRPAFGP